MIKQKKMGFCLNVVSMVLCVSAMIFAFSTTALCAENSAVMLSPTRVIFEGRTRAATVKMINPNNVAQTYKIELISLAMDERGDTKEISDSDQQALFARKLIRFSPRRVTLGPKKWQTIRLMVRKPKDLSPGEYRSQLRVTPIYTPGKQDPKKPVPSQNISIGIDIVFAISIPIIVRHGKGQVEVIPHPPKLISKNDTYFMETKLERKGMFSVYSDALLFFTPEDNAGKKIKIGERNGVSIHALNPYQIVRIPLKNSTILPGKNAQGTIYIEIKDREKQDRRILGAGEFATGK